MSIALKSILKIDAHSRKQLCSAAISSQQKEKGTGKQKESQHTHTHTHIACMTSYMFPSHLPNVYTDGCHSTRKNKNEL